MKRQGDVLIKSTNKKISKNAKTGEVTVALGEATGHHHTIYPRKGEVSSVQTGTEQFLVAVEQEAELIHQEHEPITLQKGVYEIKVQRELNALGEIRRVMD